MFDEENFISLAIFLRFYISLSFASFFREIFALFFRAGNNSCGQERSTISTIFNKISVYYGLGLVKTLSRPSATARTG